MLIFENHNEIVNLCEMYDIENYHINPDGTVDVDGSVHLPKYGLTELPLKFGRVLGSFYCEKNKLKSLEGSPVYVGGYFDCSHNKLKSLESGPKFVHGSYWCDNNKLTSLVGSPNSLIGNFSFDFSNNRITSLVGGPKNITYQIYFDDSLPEKIVDNQKYLKDIFYWQDEYRIWKSDGTLDVFRFDEMMIDILNDWKEGNQIK
jgi:hypothetical protein